MGQEVKNKDNPGFAPATRISRCAMDLQEREFAPEVNKKGCKPTLAASL
jgi:hypothetical protein